MAISSFAKKINEDKLYKDLIKSLTVYEIFDVKKIFKIYPKKAINRAFYLFNTPLNDPIYSFEVNQNFSLMVSYKILNDGLHVGYIFEFPDVEYSIYPELLLIKRKNVEMSIDNIKQHGVKIEFKGESHKVIAQGTEFLAVILNASFFVDVKKT